MNQTTIKNNNEQDTLNSLKEVFMLKMILVLIIKLLLMMFFAFPSQEGQFYANDFSKHNIFKTKDLIKKIHL